MILAHSVFAAETLPAGIGYKPGVRPPRPGTVTITAIQSNKVRYDENENATAKVTLVNTSHRPYRGKLIVLMHVDLDEPRDITRTEFAVGSGETATWQFSYNVGPETYGRGLEVRFVDEDGVLVDAWQEYFGVAAEWFRIQQHTYAAPNRLYDVNSWVTYRNHAHYFAHEPTDFGVHPAGAEIYLSGQTGYRVNQSARQAQMDFLRNRGVKFTFYQTFAFCGQAGYEEMRKHPEYALYDENGQPAVDPIYGGHPNPMELASPLETGPKRRTDKPWLDRAYTPWQHCAANLALDEAVMYQTRCIKKYAEELGFDGIYIDGNMGVLRGFAYDGTPNVPSGQPNEFAKLSARNHRLFSGGLKQDDPNFGTWFNWGYRSIEWAIRMGLTHTIGSGTGARGDVGDENVRAATAWNNVMLLDETGSFLKSPDAPKPREFLSRLVEQRDFAVQKWGASTIIGYSFVAPHVTAEQPGPSKWGWATLNCLGAQLIATQVHYAAGFLPSYRPMLQFTTRYSSLLWAPDIRVLPAEQTSVRVSAPDDILWQELVYRRETPEGYDLLVHLVRLPPTEHWDIRRVDEPEPLKGVRVNARLGSDELRQAQVIRPFQFEEEQQTVQKELEGIPGIDGVSVEVPPFRYHSLVVFRVRS